jgi:aldehyde:ferredoxin oxidoreductase
MPWFKRPDGTKGLSVEEEKFKKTVAQYYEMRGWDHNGRPTKEKLDTLDLSEIADELVQMGKINR